MTRYLLAILALLGLAGTAHAADPVVSNVRAAQRAGTKLVDIWYDLADADGNSCTVSVAVSTNNGATFDLPASSFSGAVGGGLRRVVTG